MLFVNLLATVGLALSMSVEAAALPRGRRSAAHNKFVLVRSPQTATGDNRDTVMTTVADVTALTNSTAVNSTFSAVPSLEESLPTAGLDETASIINGTGANTVPPPLNETDPVVSELISSLAASTTAYATFSYSAYVPTATVEPPAISATPSSGPAWAQPADPVDQALQAAQSYAMQQAIGSHMPTVTVELVMVPTQEADGTWDYVVHIGSDGTATAVPTFSAGTTLPTESASQVIDSPAPAYTTQASPYIHTPVQPVSIATQSSPYIHTPVQPAPLAEESSPADEDDPAQWSEAGPEATDVAGNPTPWTPASPTSTSYYTGQGYVSDISSDGRGAATFIYSTTVPSATHTPTEPLAWTSGKGQQHAYPWMTASETPAASPVVTAESSAWTSGKGQQHAYPWMTASQDQAPAPVTTSAWISGHGQQHAYPWTTQAVEPSPTDAPTGASSATTDANGVIVATLVPMTSVAGGSSSTAEQTIESPWLVPATQISSSSPSSVETAGAAQSGAATVNTDSVVVAPSPSSTISGETQPSPVQAIITDPLSHAGAGTISSWSTSVESAQATSVHAETSQDASNMTVIGTEGLAPSSTSSGIVLIPISSTTEASTIAIPTGAETFMPAESAYQPEATARQSETGASAATSAVNSASDVASGLPVVSSGLSSSDASSTGFIAIQNPSPTGSDSASRTESLSSTMTSIASQVIASATHSLIASTTELTSALSSVETLITASSSASDLPSTTNSSSAETQATVTPESQSTQASATGIDTTIITETLVSSPTGTDAEAVATMTPVESASASSPTSQAEQSIQTTILAESDAAATSTSDDGDGIATETFTAWTTLDITATSAVEVVSETGSSTASNSVTSTQSTSEMALPTSSLTQSNTDTSATSIMSTSAATSATETGISSSQTESSSSVSESSAASAWESTAVPTAMSSTIIEVTPTSTESATAAFPTSDADIPFCEDDGEGDWEEVWVDEEDIQPDWEVLE